MSSAPSTSIFSASIAAIPASRSTAINGLHGTRYGLAGHAVPRCLFRCACRRCRCAQHKLDLALAIGDARPGTTSILTDRIGREMKAQPLEDAGLRLDRERCARRGARRDEERIEPDIGADIDEGETCARGEAAVTASASTRRSSCRTSAA